MEEKYSVAEFAALVGTTSKTIYERIKKNDKLTVNEQLKTVNEIVKGREVTLILTNSEQIEFYKNIYGNLPVINGEYYENLTDNNGEDIVNNSGENVNINNNNTFNPDIVDKLITLNNDYNEKISTVNNELIKVNKELAIANGNLKLLEYQAGRDALILNENTELKKVNNRKQKIIYALITVIIILLTVIITSLTYLLTVNNFKEENKVPVTEKTINSAPAAQENLAQ